MTQVEPLNGTSSSITSSIAAVARYSYAQTDIATGYFNYLKPFQM